MTLPVVRLAQVQLRFDLSRALARVGATTTMKMSQTGLGAKTMVMRAIRPSNGSVPKPVVAVAARAVHGREARRLEVAGAGVPPLSEPEEPRAPRQRPRGKAEGSLVGLAATPVYRVAREFVIAANSRGILLKTVPIPQPQVGLRATAARLSASIPHRLRRNQADRIGPHPIAVVTGVLGMARRMSRASSATIVVITPQIAQSAADPAKVAQVQASPTRDHLHSTMRVIHQARFAMQVLHPPGPRC